MANLIPSEVTALQYLALIFKTGFNNAVSGFELKPRSIIKASLIALIAFVIAFQFGGAIAAWDEGSKLVRTLCAFAIGFAIWFLYELVAAPHHLYRNAIRDRNALQLQLENLTQSVLHIGPAFIERSSINIGLDVVQAWFIKLPIRALGAAVNDVRAELVGIERLCTGDQTIAQLTDGIPLLIAHRAEESAQVTRAKPRNFDVLECDARYNQLTLWPWEHQAIPNTLAGFFEPVGHYRLRIAVTADGADETVVTVTVGWTGKSSEVSLVPE